MRTYQTDHADACLNCRYLGIIGRIWDMGHGTWDMIYEIRDTYHTLSWVMGGNHGTDR